jgi:hypothetical protein
MYKLYLTFTHLPKYLNKKLRSNRFKNNKENKSWDMIIEMNCCQKKPSKPLTKATVSIIRHSYRFLDYDGLVGSLKPVVDALVSSDILIDDNWNVVGKWNVDQKFRSKKDGPMLEILVQELPDKRI